MVEDATVRVRSCMMRFVADDGSETLWKKATQPGVTRSAEARDAPYDNPMMVVEFLCSALNTYADAGVMVTELGERLPNELISV